MFLGTITVCWLFNSVYHVYAWLITVRITSFSHFSSRLGSDQCLVIRYQKGRVHEMDAGPFLVKPLF